MSSPLDRLSDEEREQADPTSMPDWMDPMLAKLTHDHFSDPEWIYERKLDGERVITYVNDDGDVRLMSRNQKQLNDSYPEIEEALGRQAPAACILDGEMVVFDENGVSDFQRLQPRMHASSREESLQSDVDVHYYVFDCMYVDGHDISAVPLRERKKILRAALEWDDPIRWMQHRDEEGEAFLEEACESGWEGLIAKKADSAYVHSRSSHWLKFKCVRQQEFVIGGWTEPHGERRGFGALLVGFYRDGDLVYAGKVGTGYDDVTLESLHDRMTKIERETSPFDVGDVPKKGAHFVKPKLVCEVKFTEWTGGDRLRHPAFVGLRRDKDAGDVRKEAEAQAVES
jgi:bifunctional non-homologous end joining protein LigD